MTFPAVSTIKMSPLEAAKESGLKTNVPKLKKQMPSVQSVSLNTHISGEKKATTTHRTRLAIHGNSSFVQMSGKWMTINHFRRNVLFQFLRIHHIASYFFLPSLKLNSNLTWRFQDCVSKGNFYLISHGVGKQINHVSWLVEKIKVKVEVVFLPSWRGYLEGPGIQVWEATQSPWSSSHTNIQKREPKNKSAFHFLAFLLSHRLLSVCTPQLHLWLPFAGKSVFPI